MVLCQAKWHFILYGALQLSANVTGTENTKKWAFSQPRLAFVGFTGLHSCEKNSQIKKVPLKPETILKHNTDPGFTFYPFLYKLC